MKIILISRYCECWPFILRTWFCLHYRLISVSLMHISAWNYVCDMWFDYSGYLVPLSTRLSPLSAQTSCQHQLLIKYFIWYTTSNTLLSSNVKIKAWGQNLQRCHREQHWGGWMLENPHWLLLCGATGAGFTQQQRNSIMLFSGHSKQMK